MGTVVYPVWYALNSITWLTCHMIFFVKHLDLPPQGFANDNCMLWSVFSLYLTLGKTMQSIVLGVFKLPPNVGRPQS